MKFNIAKSIVFNAIDGIYENKGYVDCIYCGDGVLNKNSLVLWENEALHIKCAVKWKKEVDNS
ncbi:MAG: hypothetical protein H8D92_02265 [Pelagibacteraceae bacterium]|nr:hypothetical protein [Pelagibacteraceae bacterium]